MLEDVAEDHRVEAAALEGGVVEVVKVGHDDGVEALAGAGRGVRRELEAHHLDPAFLAQGAAEGTGATADVEDAARLARTSSRSSGRSNSK